MCERWLVFLVALPRRRCERKLEVRPPRCCEVTLVCIGSVNIDIAFDEVAKAPVVVVVVEEEEKEKEEEEEEEEVEMLELDVVAVVVCTMKSTAGDKKCATLHCTVGSFARRSEIC